MLRGRILSVGIYSEQTYMEDIVQNMTQPDASQTYQVINIALL